MFLMKLSTAATIEVGPALDSAGAEYTGLVIGDLRLVKAGTGAAMAASATLTHVANGHYTLVFTTGNTDTLGTLTVSCHKSTYQMPRVLMQVIPVKVYDSIVAGSDNLEVDAIQLLGTAILTPATAGTLDVNTKLLGGATVNATTSVTIPASSTLATTGGAVGSVTGAVGSVTGAVASVTGAVGSVTGAVGSVTGAVGSVTGNVGGNVTGSVASVVGAVGSVTGLTVANLDAAVSTRMATYAQPTGFLAATFPATVASTTNITAITGNITGNLSGSVGSVTGAVGSVTGSVGSVTGAVGSVTGAVTVGTISPNVITASALATDAVNEIADQVWDELLSGHTGAGSTGAGLTSASSAGDPWSTVIPASYGAGTAGKILGDNVNATISSRASQTSLDTLDDYVDTEVAAIKTKTDQLTFTVANQIDSNALTNGGLSASATRSALGLATNNLDSQISGLATPTNITSASGIAVSSIGANVVTASALATDAVNEIADQVWDELLSGHTTSGSTGAGLTSASSAGDPWSTALPGAYGSGTAGKIVGDNVNATISSRASQTSLDTLDDYVDTEVGAIKTKTDQLTFTVANQIDANTLTIGANVITAAAIATDAIGSAEISAAAVTKIQSGLATPTNITAGTITTVSSVTGLTAANLDTTVSSRASQTSLDALDASVTTASTEIF